MVFLYSFWRGLPLSTRMLIAKQFGIAKVGSTHVSGNVILDDGYRISDVENALSIENITLYINNPNPGITDPKEIWDAMVAKIEGRTIPQSATPVITHEDEPESEKETAIEPEKKRRGRPKKIRA